MDTQILMNIIMVVTPIILVVGVVAVWFATWVLFQEGAILGGVVLTILSLLATFFAVVTLNIQFGWSVPFDFSGRGFVW